MKATIDEEFDIYLWHQFLINGNSNIAWLRNMFFRITQKIIHQDLRQGLLYVAVVSPSQISKALVCKRSWVDPPVVRQAKVLLGSDRVVAKEMVNRNRMQLLKAFKLAYRKQKETEIEELGENSYYKRIQLRPMLCPN